MSLDDLRSELDGVDAELVQLAARRQELVEKIGEVKRGEGKRTRDFAREKEVIERARAMAEEHDLPPDLAENMLRLLIEQSLTKQEQERVAARGSGDGRGALVIGGAGRMGQWFAQFLNSQGYAVQIADPSGPVPGFDSVDEWSDVELDHELIVVAAPMRATSGILRRLAEHKPNGVVFDIGSLKSPLKGGIEALREAGVSVTSLHPMFGPDAQLLSGRHVVFVDVGDAEATAAARRLFEPTMAIQVDMSLEEHDRAMAYVLGLSHALNVTFFNALSESGEAAPALARLSSTTFDAQLEIARQVASENPHLYYEIQALNDYGDEALKRLTASAGQVRHLVQERDEEGFVEMMRSGRAYLDEL